MESVQKFQQAYLQAPWRRQLQIALTFLLVLISVAIVAYIYLSVTTRAAAVGREIQYMQVRMSGYHSLTGMDTGAVPVEELKQDIANLEAQLGILTSFQVMDERAQELGLQPADPTQLLYLEVTGYQGQQPAVMAPPPEPVIVSAAGISPDFRESLIDWIELEILQTAKLFREAQQP
jgi:hypothetical protein